LQLLADAYGKLGESEKQRRALQKRITLADDDLPALEQLARFAEQDQDWQGLARYAEKILAVQPLLPLGHRWLATAAEQLDQPHEAVAPLTALTHFEPVDPAGLHHR